MSRLGKSIEREQIRGGQGRGRGEGRGKDRRLLPAEFRAAFWEDENVLQVDDDDSVSIQMPPTYAP